MTTRNQSYLAYGEVAAMSGDIVEVGLGEGHIVRYCLPKPRITSYRNYERDPAVVARYLADNPDVEPKHDIVEDDFLLTPITPTRFNVAVVDLFEDWKTGPQHYDNAKAVIQRLENILLPGGKIMVEFQGDVEYERAFRRWAQLRYGRLQTEFYNSGITANSRHVGWYNL